MIPPPGSLPFSAPQGMLQSLGSPYGMQTWPPQPQQVQAVTIHATNNYFVTVSLDSTWCFDDLDSGLCLTQVEDASGSSKGYTSAAFHPYGLILGTGTTEAIVKIWDVKSQANVARFDGHIGEVTAISFSENGYFLAMLLSCGIFKN